MNILICDDEAIFLETLRAHVHEYMKNHFITCNITATTEPGDILANTETYTLAFLDIQMERIDGISLAKELKRRNGKIAIFFVTSFREYQDDAMDLNAFRYFEKPFDVNRLYSGLDKAMEYIDGAYIDFFLYDQTVQKRILVDDVLYVMRDNRRVILTTRDDRFSTRESLDDWCQKLPNLFFYQVHKSFLVNLHYVNKYAYSELYLTNGDRIPIATRKQSDFHKYWFEYLRRR
jgi:two-component system LytT family response regulator